jgi:hypothetical protein
MKKRITYIVTSLFLVFSFPISVLADTVTDSPAPAAVADTPTSSTMPTAAAPAPAPINNSNNSSVAPPTTTPGPASPTGADSNTYTYNATTGLWENQYYTWNPTTNQTSPKTPQDYSYNPTTGKWDTTQYVYDAPSGSYIPNTVSASSNPNPVSDLQANNNISNTGPNSANSVNTSSNNNAVFNLFYDARISNTLNQSAVSGSAAVTGNTIGGSALSGNALDVMNVINMLKSSFGLQNAADLLTFTQNINGNVVGDLQIDPNQINNQSVAVDNSNTQNNLTINAKGSGLINNDITLGANSGNATVDSNTNAGNATTGNASAVANVVNMINSAITANKSFLGVININGNLDGDILLPPNFIDQLFASNAPHATVALNNSTTNNLTANATNNELINNDVTLAAKSGNANVDNNTTAGNAATGSANTNLTLFNLTGKQVIDKDSILVFVNVLGQWVGLIMDAPAGTTAAALGGNVTSNNSVNNTASANSTTNNAINNNVKVNSQSGDATVSNNTNAGSATSGNTTASANIGNIIDSQLSASDWFGILFINVLGTWHGSFGIDTAAGTIAKQAEQSASSASNGSGNNQAPAKVAVFRFTPKINNSAVGGIFNHGVAGTEYSNMSGSSTNANDQHPVILASSVQGNHPGSSLNNNANPNIAKAESPKQQKWLLPAASFAVVMAATSAIGSTGESSDKLYAKLLSHRLKKG